MAGKQKNNIVCKEYQNGITFQNNISESSIKLVLLSKTLFLEVIPKWFYFPKYCF